MTYEPNVVDINFMKDLVSGLKVGGVWFYKNLPIMFKKTAKKTMTLIAAPPGLLVEEQIERNRVVMKAAGIEFVDDRKQP